MWDVRYNKKDLKSEFFFHVNKLNCYLKNVGISQEKPCKYNAQLLVWMENIKQR